MNRKVPSEQELARELLEAGSVAALATLSPGGAPFASYVLVAAAENGEPLMLLSQLAEHTRNLARDARASLLLVREPPPGAERMTALRLTLVGHCTIDDSDEAKRRYRMRHPDSERYAGFSDFSLYRFRIARGHLVAGFGRIVDLSAGELLSGRTGPSG